MHHGGRIDISLVIPLLDEEGSIRELYERSVAELDRLGRAFEILCVDDGSTDRTYLELERLAGLDSRLKLLRFERNFGQTAALAAGFCFSRGAIVVAMDGDLQNDPEDIGRLVERLEAGADVVSGWRRRRQDAALNRRLPSLAGNWLISRASGLALHDHGCTLKAYRRHVARTLSSSGESHRLLAVVAARAGARVSEIEVRHHPRRAGRSKYGLERTPRVLLDLLRIWLFSGEQESPRARLARLVLEPFPRLDRTPEYRLREALNLPEGAEPPRPVRDI